jgi:hypothetical protein
MVESAIYFPFIVLAIMFTIYVMIDMYSAASLQARLHLAVRAKSGGMSGVTDVAELGGGTGYDRYRAAAFAKRMKIKEGKVAGTAAAMGSASERYGAGRMVGKVRVDMSARSYAISEIDGLRSAIRK